MSVEAVEAVWADPRDNQAAHQLLLVALAWRTVNRRGGIAEVSQQRLAAMTGLSRRYVRDLLAELERAGALVVEWSKPAHRTRYRVNVGDLAVPVAVAELAETPAYQLALPVDNDPSGDRAVINNRAAIPPLMGRHTARVIGKEEKKGGPTPALWIPGGT